MAWTPENLQFLLTRLRANTGDSTDVDVRNVAQGSPDIAETLSAFGNSPDGGTIILGLDPENEFIATGVEDPGTLEAVIAAQARTAVAPRVRVSFQRTVLEGETVVLATVAGLPPNARPCRTSQGSVAYLRQPDGNCRMSEQEIAQVSASGRRPRFDAHPVDETSTADLDPQLRDQFLHIARSTSRRLSEFADDDILRFKRVVEPHGDRLTLAGLYALGRYPQQFEPQLTITAVAEAPAPGGVRNLDRTEFDGPLPELLERAVEWVQRNTRTEVLFASDGHGRDETEIPMVAVRELIANALVHRDLGPHTAGKNIHIRLTNNRLTITSPGGLWGLSRDQLGWPGGKSAVNEFLYEICKMTRTASAHRVIEGEGGGLREVRQSLRDAGHRSPGFHDNGVRFAASVSRRTPIAANDRRWLQVLPANTRLSEIQRQVLASMRNGHTWTEQLIRDEYAPIDTAHAQATLQGLVAEGLAVANSGGRAPSYSISPVLASMPAAALQGTVSTRAPRHALASTGDELVIGLGAEAADAPKKSKKSKNANAILGELQAGPLEVTDISTRTGLTPNQIRYALSPLLSSGIVMRDGGQGHKLTVYRLANQ